MITKMTLINISITSLKIYCLSKFLICSHFSLSCIGAGNGNPLQCSCLENPRERGSLVGCHLWGRTESDMTEAT